WASSTVPPTMATIPPASLEVDPSPKHLPKAKVQSVLNNSFAFYMVCDNGVTLSANEIVGSFSNTKAQLLLDGTKMSMKDGTRKPMFALMGSKLVAVIAGSLGEPDLVCAAYDHSLPDANPEEPFYRALDIQSLKTTDRSVLVCDKESIKLFNQNFEMVSDIAFHPDRRLDTFWHHINREGVATILGVSAARFGEVFQQGILAWGVSMETKAVTVKMVGGHYSNSVSNLPQKISAIEVFDGHSTLMSLTTVEANTSPRVLLENMRYAKLSAASVGSIKSAHWVAGDLIVRLSNDGVVSASTLIEKRCVDLFVTPMHRQHQFKDVSRIVAGTLDSGMPIIAGEVSNKKSAYIMKLPKEVAVIAPQSKHGPAKALNKLARIDFQNKILGLTGSPGGSTVFMVDKTVNVGKCVDAVELA
ncbi:MAG: hypothetical protein SGILL_009359, partial [Bacillariaceae sp.]